MKKIILACFVLLAFLSPVKAVAPVLAFVATTSAGTTTISAASTAVGLALSALAVLATTTNPFKITFPKTTGVGTLTEPSTFVDINGSSITSATGSCRIFYKRTVFTAPSTATSIVSFDWTFFQSGVSCASSSSSIDPATTNNCTAANYPECTHYTDVYKLQCFTSPNCGTFSLNQIFESNGNSSALDQQQQIAHGFGSTNPDNTISIKSDGTALSYDLTDPQLPSSVGGETGFPAPISSGGMALQYTNDAGQNTVVVQQPNGASVGHTVTEYNQLPAAEVQVSEMVVNRTGTVSGHSTSVQPGYVNPVPATAPATSVTYQPIVSTNPNPGTEPGTGGEVQFPSDYARAGEAAAAAQNVVDGLLSGEVVTPEVPDEEMPWFGSTFDGVLPTINTSGATCPVWQFDAIGESFYIDHHCQLIADFNALFYAMFTAFWVLLAFRTVLEA